MDNFGLSDRICEMDESELFNLMYNNSENMVGDDTFDADTAKMDMVSQTAVLFSKLYGV